MGGERCGPCRRQRRARRRFPFEQMSEKAGRPAHGLAGVVEEVIESRQPSDQEPREQLDARGVAQVETMDLQSVAKIGVIGFGRIPVGGVDGKARRHDDVRAGAQQLQGRLESNFDAGAGDHGPAAAQIRGLLTLGVVEVPALGAHRVVVAVQPGIRLLADVADPLLGERGTGRVLRLVAGFRPLQPQRREGGRAALNPLARLLDDPAVLRPCGGSLGPPESLGHARHIVPFGLRDQAGEHQELAAPLRRDRGEVRAIRLDRPQHLEARGQIVVGEHRTGRITSSCR